MSNGTFALSVFLRLVSSNTSTPCLQQPREKRKKSRCSWEFRMGRLKAEPNCAAHNLISRILMVSWQYRPPYEIFKEKANSARYPFFEEPPFGRSRPSDISPPSEEKRSYNKNCSDHRRRRDSVRVTRPLVDFFLCAPRGPTFLRPVRRFGEFKWLRI